MSCINSLVKKPYRKAVDITYEDAAAAFQELPTAIFSNVKFYPCTTFKVAPKWGPATRLIPCLKCLVDSSQGCNVHQKSMLAHLKQWSTDMGMDFLEETCDRVVLVLRAVLGQLLNHKSSPGRVPPKAYWPKYAVIWEKLSSGAASQQQPGQPIADPMQPAISDIADAIADADVSEVEVVDSAAPAPETLEIASSQEEQKKDAGLDMATLFSSSDTGLHRLLNGDEPKPTVCRRHRCKSSETARDLGMPDSKIKSLTQQVSNKTVSPKAFRDLNVDLKSKGGKNTKKTKKKKKKTVKKKPALQKKPAADAGPGPAAGKVPDQLSKRFLNCAHSRFWHPARNKALAAGKSIDDAKEEAKIAAAAEVARLRKMFKDGLIDSEGRFTVKADSVDES